MRLVRHYDQHERETDGAVHWKLMGPKLRKALQKAGGQKLSNSDWQRRPVVLLCYSRTHKCERDSVESLFHTNGKNSCSIEDALIMSLQSSNQDSSLEDEKARKETDHLLHNSQPIRGQSRWRRTQRWPFEAEKKYSTTTSGDLVRTPSTGSTQPEHKTKDYISGKRHNYMQLCADRMHLQSGFSKEERTLFERLSTPRPEPKIVLKTSWQSQEEQRQLLRAPGSWCEKGPRYPNQHKTQKSLNLKSTSELRELHKNVIPEDEEIMEIFQSGWQITNWMDTICGRQENPSSSAKSRVVQFTNLAIMKCTSWDRYPEPSSAKLAWSTYRSDWFSALVAFVFDLIRNKYTEAEPDFRLWQFLIILHLACPKRSKKKRSRFHRAQMAEWWKVSRMSESSQIDRRLLPTGDHDRVFAQYRCPHRTNQDPACIRRQKERVTRDVDLGARHCDPAASASAALGAVAPFRYDRTLRAPPYIFWAEESYSFLAHSTACWVTATTTRKQLPSIRLCTAARDKEASAPDNRKRHETNSKTTPLEGDKWNSVEMACRCPVRRWENWIQRRRKDAGKLQGTGKTTGSVLFESQDSVHQQGCRCQSGSGPWHAWHLDSCASRPVNGVLPDVAVQNNVEPLLKVRVQRCGNKSCRATAMALSAATWPVFFWHEPSKHLLPFLCEGPPATTSLVGRHALPHHVSGWWARVSSSLLCHCQLGDALILTAQTWLLSVSFVSRSLGTPEGLVSHLSAQMFCNSFSCRAFDQESNQQDGGVRMHAIPLHRALVTLESSSDCTLPVSRWASDRWTDWSGAWRRLPPRGQIFRRMLRWRHAIVILWKRWWQHLAYSSSLSNRVTSQLKSFFHHPFWETHLNCLSTSRMDLHFCRQIPRFRARALGFWPPEADVDGSSWYVWVEQGERAQPQTGTKNNHDGIGRHSSGETSWNEKQTRAVFCCFFRAPSSRALSTCVAQWILVWTFRLNVRIWRGPVSTGDESSRHHISMEHRLRKLNSDTDASIENTFWQN